LEFVGKEIGSMLRYAVRSGSIADEAHDARLFARSAVLLRRWLGVAAAIKHVSTPAGVLAVKDAIEDVALESHDFLHKYP